MAMQKERLNHLFEAAGISKKEFAQLLNINVQTVYVWESTQAAPYWIWSGLENYATARVVDKVMARGKKLEEGGSI